MNFNTRCNLDGTMKDMLNELYLAKPENATKFMAEYLLTHNGKSLPEFKKLLVKKLKYEKEIYAAIVEEEKIKKCDLENMITALERKKISDCQEILDHNILSSSSSSKENVPTQLDPDMDNEDTSDDMRKYDFIPHDIIKMYKRRNRNTKKIKKEKENMSVVIYPSLSAPFLQ